MNPRVGLKDLLAPFRKSHTPLIVLHQEHAGYGSDFGKEHEAGFDSWMTAELFVKLVASKVPTSLVTRCPPPSSPPHLISFSNSSSDSDSDGSPGGAPLNNSSNKDVEADHHQPAAWHERQLNGRNRNLFSVLANVDDSAREEEDPTTQWLPPFEHAFWEVYMNKLRVNASEGGVCDLAERETDERLDGFRRRVKGKKQGGVYDLLK